jgi:hypothetical protein
MTDSSFTTYISLLMAATDKPAPAERIAVFDIRLLPGRESRIDCASFFGSCGTLDAGRTEHDAIDTAGAVREIVVGRRRAIPGFGQQDVEF